jgi:mono/diheme cytochrome c family protein
MRGLHAFAGTSRQTEPAHERVNSKRFIAVLAAAACAALGTASAQDPAARAASADVKRGRYVVQIGGCNDCHTPGYPESKGKVDEKLWLTGSPLGWRGPWGTTYASNLRLVAQSMTEAQWMTRARSEMRPPMPWFNVRDMSDGDVRAVYRYLRHLGPAGAAAPAYAPPDKEPKPPFVQFPAPPK